MEDITVVVTSNGRPELLNKTLGSFWEFNSYPISDVIVIDDSGDWDKQREIFEICSHTVIFPSQKRGQVICIDDAYSLVKTPWIFHCEDDWFFYKEGFMEESLEILQTNKDIMQVWLTHMHELPVEKWNDKWGLLSTNFYGWSGFTFNPGLRRKADYLDVAPYSRFGNTGEAEKAIGEEYHRLGFRAAILKDEYCKHIG